MEDYSLGQKKKVLLAASLSQQAHLYIWDEPMNYIDIFSRDQIAGLIQKYSPTMLLVEHDRAFAEGVSTRRIRLSSPIIRLRISMSVWRMPSRPI